MPEPSQRRLLVIGIDGATFDLFDPMMRRGLLPNLAALAARGFRAVLRSTIPPNSAAAWSTFMTGKNPGRHGILRFQATRPTAEIGREFRPGAYTFLNSDSLVGRRIWDVLGDHGKRVAVMNVPLTYPPRPLNGLMITGLLTPPGARDFTWPPELAASLGDYQIEQPLAAMGYSQAADRELVRSSLEILQRQGDTALQLFRREPWDFFFVCFTGTDRLQHRLWNQLAAEPPSAAPSSIPNPEAAIQNPDDPSEWFRANLDQYYRLLDAAIGRLVDAAGGRTNCLILSDHGFGPAPKLAVFRRVLARRLGLEAGEGVGRLHRLRAWLERHGILNGDRLRRLLAGTPLRRLLSRLARVAVRQEHAAWRASDAYLVVLHKYIGGVGINVPPSDPRYEPLRQSLMDRLAEICDPDSGEPILTDIWRREDLYHGACVGVCPDVIFRLDGRYGLSHGDAPGGRLVQRKTFRGQGIHRDEGILLLAGPDVLHAASARPFLIPDATATALCLLDTPLPTDLDGQVIADALAPGFLDAHPVRLEPVAEPAETTALAEARWRSPNDEDAVADQLRDLGYLD